MSLQRRSATQLSGRLNRHLSQYTLAASAAGLGALALAQPADAKIIYTSANTSLNFPGNYKLDLNHDGIADFDFHVSQFATSSFLRILPKSKNLIEGTDHFASALDAGVSVHSSTKLQASNTIMCGTSINSKRGHWLNVPNRYLGLKFYVKGKAHYGWARLKTSACRATLTGYAYETIPNKAIVTGKTKGPDVITLEPGSLGALATGAAGRSGK
jgi:hypothetical protein